MAMAAGFGLVGALHLDALNVMDAMAVGANGGGDRLISLPAAGPAMDTFQISRVGFFLMDVVFDDQCHLIVAA
jgi:hypothetical protein